MWGWTHSFPPMRLCSPFGPRLASWRDLSEALSKSPRTSSPTSEHTLEPSLRTDARTSLRMARTRGQNNSLEKALRSALFREGLRYRIHHPVPGRPRRTIDIAFPPRKLAVFVDGCFWHGCPIHGTWPKRNSSFWRSKIEVNRERDADTDETLRSAGWLVIRFWEHEREGMCVGVVLRQLNLST